MTFEIKADIYRTLITLEKSTRLRTKSARNLLMLPLELYNSSKKQFNDKGLLQKIGNLQNEEFGIVFIDFIKFDESEIINLEKMKKQYEALFDLVKGEFGVLIATHNDEFKLPSTGMLDYIFEQNFLGIKKENTKGYFVSKREKFKNNKLPICYLFSFNSKLNFIDLDTFLKTQKLEPLIITPKLPFTQIISKSNEIYTPLTTLINNNLKEKVCLILIGSPASGKSYFATQIKLFDKFIRLNNDTIQNTNKMISLFKEHIFKGDNIILDNTNPIKEKRDFYIQFAKKKDYKVFALFFDFPKEFVLHLNQLRRFSFFKNSISGPAPQVAIHGYFKKLEKPVKSEGFTEVVIIDKFHPNFDSEKKNKYFKYIYA